ncbi:GGDEF domain-containing protein [Marinobacter salarius]|jgi:diguanylate cyclase (GGDEF)-like protein|uniref:GGDEF domain-containing protein n=1 Tax=Marinobacter salarius TaxID=1420917 RepID=UPI0018F1A4D3|nr:GGDEF domain-containing protein [Marinobacter salarius]MBJ7276114.1 GGDEF domain-containing protein [Marinobacter salarius]
MGFTVHLPTLLLLSVAINLLIGGLLWAIFRLRSRQHCFRLWALACMTFALGTLFAGTRAFIDTPWITVFLAHLFLGLSPLLVLAGLQRFSGSASLKNRRFGHALRLSAAGYLLILLFTFQGDPLNAHLLTALFSAAIFSFAVYTLSKLNTTPSLPVRILKVLFTMHGVLMLSQALVIGMDGLGLNQANTGFVLRLILVNHILLATATALALPLLAFTHSEQRLRVMAERDGLTGLYNRRSLFREGIRAFDQATQSDTQLAVLMLDLDHFKQVNDRWGHAAGDDALRLVARTLKNELRDDDIIGRVGGEEFAMVLRITGDDDVRIITRRLLDTIATNGQEIDGLPLHISASIGGVEKADHHKTFADMMIEADAALYNAKDKGRNRAEFGRLTPETSVS